MNKYSCTMASVSDIWFATLIAEDDQKAKEMAAAETKQGRPRNWSVRILEADVAEPAGVLSTGHREA